MSLGIHHIIAHAKSVCEPDGETIKVCLRGAKRQTLLREIHRSQKALGKISLMDWVEGLDGIKLTWLVLEAFLISAYDFCPLNPFNGNFSPNGFCFCSEWLRCWMRKANICLGMLNLIYFYWPSEDLLNYQLSSVGQTTFSWISLLIWCVLAHLYSITQSGFKSCPVLRDLLELLGFQVKSLLPFHSPHKLQL